MTSAPYPTLRHHLTIPSLGIVQILNYGASYYLPGVLGQQIAAATGWSYALIIAGLSLGLGVSGLCSIVVGKLIERHGGKLVLAGGTVLIAIGLCCLASSASTLTYFLSWGIMGLGMSAALYDAAFATLGWLYGQRARRAISTLTLWSGFASTVSWPLSAFLVERIGWRFTCLSYAALELLVCLPMILLCIPAHRSQDVETGPTEQTFHEPRPLDHRLASFLLLALVLTLGSTAAAVISVHLVTILQANGMGYAAAVGIGAIIGPAQVFTRLIERLIGNRLHPIWILWLATGLMAMGLAILWFGITLAAIGIIAYGAGTGIWSIARGTVPLSLFGSKGYPVLMGRLAMPMLVAQAAAPSMGALLIELLGATPTLAILSTIAASCVIGIIALRFTAHTTITAAP